MSLSWEIKNWILNRLGYLNYKFNVLINEPYFGHYLSAGQAWTQRREAMRKLLEKEMSIHKGEDYKILEIGSWGGHSTTLWASICKKFNKGKVFCIDTWQASENAPKIMKKATRGDKIMKLFLHNISSSGLKKYIFPMRGTSDNIFKILKLDNFDFVYIDGDHAYSQFKRDLINYSRLCKFGGVVCGDDLEILPSELDLENARKHQEEDFILDTKVKRHFHPGIALAIKEFFGDVSMLNGFWAMRKNKKKWEKVSLE